MKDKTANLLVDAFEDMLATHRVSAEQILEGILETPLSPKSKRLVRIGFKAGIKPIFKRMPEPKKEKVMEALAMIRVFKGAPYKVRKLFMQAAKELPHPPGGPPRKIRPEEERTVCAEIIALRDECDTGEAIRRIAAKRHVSGRTIYRIWGKYHPKKKTQTAARP